MRPSLHLLQATAQEIGFSSPQQLLKDFEAKKIKAESLDAYHVAFQKRIEEKLNDVNEVLGPLMRMHYAKLSFKSK